MAKISGVKFTGAPGSTFKIKFEGNGIDETKISNEQYKSEINATVISYELYVALRDCEIGEQFTSDG